MSDIKFCPSCGTKLSASAAFCHQCGQKQAAMPTFAPASPKSQETDQIHESSQPEAEQIAETSSPAEVIQETPAIETQINDQITSPDEAQPEEKPAETIESTEAPAAETEQKADLTAEPDDQPAPEINDSEDVTAEPKEEPANVEAEEPVSQAAPEQQPETPAVQKVSEQTASIPIQQAAPSQQVGAVPPSQPQYQAPYQPQYQQPYYPQNPMPQQAQAVQPPKRNKFPWFFTILWIIMLGAVGVWAYFLLIHPTYDYPLFTEDAKRIVLFAMAVSVLIYTSSLKLTMKKFKAFPTIILVLAALVVFYFFCMWEMTEGDWLHDTLSEITSNILPASGD